MNPDERRSVLPVPVPATLPYYKTKDLLAAVPPLVRGDLESGSDVEALEGRFAAHLGGGECVAMPTARVGLYYMLRALELPPESEVLMTPITIADMVNMIRCAGLTPVMVDMDPDTIGFDVDHLRASITTKTRAILLTPLYGVVPDGLDEVLSVAAEHDLVVLEDISQALGAELRGTRLGRIGRASVCSLSSFKVCSSLFGGIVCSDDAALVERVRAISRDELKAPPRRRFTSLLPKILAFQVAMSEAAYPLVTFPAMYAITRLTPGLRDRLRSGDLRTMLGLVPRTYGTMDPALLHRYTDFQARMALESIERVDGVNDALVAMAHELLERVEGLGPRMPRMHPEGRSVFWRFPIRTDDAAALARRLADRGVETSLNALPVCSELETMRPFARGDLAGARAVHDEYLLAPLHGWFGRRRIDAVARALMAVLT